MSFRPLFGQITILSLSFVTFRVSRFHVSHLTYETFKLGLQNTLNISKTARVYFGVLQVEPRVKEQGQKKTFGPNFLMYMREGEPLTYKEVMNST